MKNSIHFTKKTLDKLTCGVKKEVYYSDIKQKSLLLRVSKAGRKTFYFYKWNSEKGYAQKLPLGDFPALALDDARDMAAEGIVKFNQKKPAAVSKTQRAKKLSTRSYIVEDLWQEYRAALSPLVKSFKGYQGFYNTHFEIWYKRDIRSISKDEIQLWVNSIAVKVSKATAHGCFANLRQFINWCIENERCSIANPCRFVKVAPVETRLRFLKPGDEFDRYVAAVDAYKDQNLCDIFRVLLWTGARLENVRSMKWSDLDLEGAGTWHIKASQSKNKKGYTIALTHDVFELLKRRRKVITDSDYVFPSKGKGKKPYITKVWVAFDRILETANITDFRIHDLRHTLASYMAMSGASLLKIAKQLGHKSLRSTEIYTHLINESAQFAAEDALEAMNNPSLILSRRAPKKPSS